MSISAAAADAIESARFTLDGDLGRRRDYVREMEAGAQPHDIGEGRGSLDDIRGWRLRPSCWRSSCG